ncbi:hypothetical protein AO365_0758 [Moraxella catarrhalis]|nr:hypothetical protein AO365_0758 [Moraxella catarrhalis]
MERLNLAAVALLAALLAAISAFVALRPFLVLPAVRNTLNRPLDFFAICPALAPAIITPHCLIQDKYQYR